MQQAKPGDEGSIYMQQARPGDEGSIYAASQGMRAVYMQQDGGRYVCYCCCMPSSVLLHIYCPHPLS